MEKSKSQESAFIGHQSLCPRSYIQEADNIGRMVFVHSRPFKVTCEADQQCDKSMEDSKLQTPGPGQYEVEIEHKRVKLGLIMAQHKKSNPLRQTLPGPGRYDTHLSSSNFRAAPSVIFSPPRLSRFIVQAKDETPGPGQYKLEKAKRLLSNFSTGCMYSISRTKRQVQKSVQQTPGPASYEPPQNFKKGHAKPESKFKFVHGFPV